MYTYIYMHTPLYKYMVLSLIIYIQGVAPIRPPRVNIKSLYLKFLLGPPLFVEQTSNLEPGY